LPESRSLLAGDSGRGQSVKCKIARKQAPTKTKIRLNLDAHWTTTRAPLPLGLA